MSARELVVAPVKIMLVVGVLFLAVVGVVNYVVPQYLISFSLGYSMCSLRSAYYDFFSLRNTTCSIVPGDAIVVHRSPPEVGDVVCINTDRGIICHRAYKVSPDEVCFVGDAAKWRGCYSWDSYVGRVVGKIPRAVAMPGGLVYGVLNGRLDLWRLVDAGSYDVVP